MNRRYRLAVAIAGLVTLSLALVFPVPRAASQVEQAPSRAWQYKVLQFPAGTVEQDALNQDGAAGWELVTISGGKAYLKKPL